MIGGHSRNIGKTSVVCSLISAMPERRWTAMKITQCEHGVCSAHGEACDCATADETIAISEERVSTTGTDSSRYLAAGAARSFWVRTRRGRLSEAMPRIRELISGQANAILESNSILRFLEPDVYASVLDPEVADFKASALRYLDRADAFLLCGGAVGQVGWDEVSLKLAGPIPKFEIMPPAFGSVEFASFVGQRLASMGR